MSAGSKPLISYPIHSSRPYQIGLVITALFPITLLALFIAHRPPSEIFWGLLALVALLPLTMWASASGYLVPGGRGSLEIYRDRIEIRTNRGSERIPFDGLQVELVSKVARFSLFFIPVGEMEQDRHLRLRGPRGVRTLSRRLFERPECVSAVANDIARVKAGDEPFGLKGPPRPSGPSWDPDQKRYEEQLERELAELD